MKQRHGEDGLDYSSPEDGSFSEVTSDLIAKYLSGECNEREQANINHWLRSASAADRAILNLPALLVKYSHITTARPSSGDLIRKADQIMQGRSPVLDNARSGESTITPSAVLPGRTGPSRLSLLKLPRSVVITTMAAAAFLLVFAGWHAGLNRSDTSVKGQASSYTTAASERNTIVLPDGSSVELSVASRLDVPADYGVTDRTLRIQGEALFTVASNSNKPFIVKAEDVTTRVLGTSFVVRKYDTDTAVSIAVLTGKVSVGTTVLTPLQRVDVSSTGMSPVMTTTNERFYFARGILSIQDMQLSDAVVELSRWYNADVRIGSPELRHRQMKGQFKAESLTDLASMLEWTLGLQVVLDGRTLTLYPGN